MNIVEPILFQCRSQAPVTAMIAPGWTLPLISYGRLERFIHNIARNAHQQGLSRGQIVALSIEEPILHAAFILGLTQLGVATVSARGTDLPKELQIDAVIADRPHVFRNAGRIIVIDLSWTEGDGVATAAPVAVHSDTDLCRISLTSGTTGEAKACAFSHNTIARRITRYNWVYGRQFPASSCIFVDPALTTSVGELFWLYTLTKGGTVFFRGPDAVETMQAFSLYNVESIVASPAALAELVEYYDQLPSFPTNFNAIVSVGSYMSLTLSERIRARLCSNLICSYGSTETHIAATAPAHAISHLVGAVGKVVPDAAVQIVDDHGNECPPNETGRLRIRSEVDVSEYLGDAAGTAKVFVDGWFYPGDYGVLTADRLLIISGREKTILNLGGDKVNPERIERVLLAYPDIRQAAAFSIINPMGIEELHAAIVAAAIDEPAIRAYCERQLPPGFMPRRFIPVDNIPMNAMGKIDRRRLAEIVKNT